MIDAAERMRSLGKRAPSGQASSIFGSAANLAQSVERDEQLRIGLYPILCPASPEAAMGIAACLGYLLEQYSNARVHRCFAKIDAADEGAEISASDYQFTVNDWELEGLADNVQVYGGLELDDDDARLSLTVDSGLRLADAVDEFQYDCRSMTELVSRLPDIAASLMDYLGESSARKAVIAYAPLPEDSPRLLSLLAKVFEWNLDVYLSFWGIDWATNEIQEQFAEIAQIARTSQAEFASWCLGMMARQVMQAGLQAYGDALVPILGDAFSGNARSIAGLAAAAMGLAELGYLERAAAWLAQSLDADSPPSAWVSLAGIHLLAGRVTDAIDTIQQALEYGLEDPALYWEYAQLLIQAEAQEWLVEELLLIDPEDYAEDLQISAEIAQALKWHLARASDDLGALKLAMIYLIDTDDEEIWTYFERLITEDLSGDFAGDIIERLLDTEERDAAYAILEGGADANVYAQVFLAQLALADEDHELAKDTIANCRDRFVEIDEELEIELQRLELSARLPNFEAAFAEIKLLLGGNRSVSEGQVELLEAAIEIAPKMVDLYVALSRCYSAWEDAESALEVMQDAESHAGRHPQIDLRLARLLWAQRQREPAIDRLNKGLAAFPGDVNLLAQMANFLIANDQLDDAREFLLRAESIAPEHRAVWQARHLVAQKLAQGS